MVTHEEKMKGVVVGIASTIPTGTQPTECSSCSDGSCMVYWKAKNSLLESKEALDERLEIIGGKKVGFSS